MTTKPELQQEIQTLKAKLQEFEQQLNNYKEITIENASPGDVLEDGSIVVLKSSGLALLAGPQSVEARCSWSKEFSRVFESLEDNGFNPSQWFVPTKEQLNLAYQNPEVRQYFVPNFYWSSTEVNSTIVYTQTFSCGESRHGIKECLCRVRPFRCVTY